MYLDEHFFKAVLSNVELKGSFKAGNYSFSLDSRTIKDDELFVPFKGESTDGHHYLAQALAKGAGALVARSYQHLEQLLQKNALNNTCIIIVDNPEQAFFTLVRAWRKQLTIPLIGVTGSLGKTSTKIILGHILTTAGKNTFISHANQNTLLGIALNLSRLTLEHEVGIFEMGISLIGEMQKMALFLEPTYAVITCIAHSHVAGLGSYATIAQEKRKIFSAFNQTSIGCINGDQPELKNVAYAHPVISFGFKTHNQIQARRLQPQDNHLTFTLRIYDKKQKVTLAQNHKGLVVNSLAASALATVLAIPITTIAQALSSIPNRSQRFEHRTLSCTKNSIVIDDCYNACPESMKTALQAFDALACNGKKIVIIADMLELGEKSLFWHRQIGRFLKKITSAQKIIFVGNHMEHAYKVAPACLDKKHVTSWQDALEQVHSLVDDNTMILVKGSHGMQLNNIVAALTKTT